LWDFGDGNTDSTLNSSHLYLSNGNYEATLFAINACGTDSTKRFVNISGVGIDEFQLFPVSIYPNPSTGLFTLELPYYSKFEVSLIDLSGKVIKTANGSGQTIQFETPDQWSGTGVLWIKTPRNNWNSVITVLPE